MNEQARALPSESQETTVRSLAAKWVNGDSYDQARAAGQVDGFLRGIRSCQGECPAVRKLEAIWTSITGEPPNISGAI